MNVKGYQYRIDVSDVERAIEVVQAIDGATVERGTVKDSITVVSGQSIARVINHALVSAGVGVDQLVHEQRGLEDVYMELTGVAPGSSLGAPLDGSPMAVPAGVQS